MGNFGFYNLAFISLITGIVSFFVTTVIKKLGANLSLVIGAFGNSLFILSSVLPALKSQAVDKDKWYFQESFVYSFMIVASLICGIG